MPSGFLLDSMRTAVTSLALHKLRTLLSVVGIVCGVSTVLAIIAIGTGAKAEALRRIGQMGISNVFIRADNLTDRQILLARQQHSQGLQFGDLERLATTGLPLKRTAASRVRRVDVVGMPEGLHPQVLETTRSYRDVLGLDIISGRFLSDRDLADTSRVCVLGWSISAALGSAGKPGSVLRFGEELWTVVGVIAPQHLDTPEKVGRVSLQDVDSMVIVPLGSMGRVRQGEPLGELIVELATVDRFDQSLALITRAVRAAHNGVMDFNIIAPFELLNQAREFQRLFAVVFGSIGALSLMVGGIGIMNIMLASVSERVREIGVRRAVGARPGHIIVQFLLEAVLLTTLGGLFGIGCGWMLARAVSWYAGWPVVFSPASFVIPMAMAVVTGCLFGLYPAFKAARMDPLQALGYGG